MTSSLVLSSEWIDTQMLDWAEPCPDCELILRRPHFTGVHASEMHSMFKTILFPIDQSRDSQEAAETVAQLVKFCNSRLLILSVQETSTEGEPAEVLSTQAIDQLLDNARSTFAEWGIQAETMHREGKPAFAICDAADEMDVNLIVMGCHGMGLTEEGMAESVSSRVINLSPCPVLIVP